MKIVIGISGIRTDLFRQARIHPGRFDDKRVAC